MSRSIRLRKENRLACLGLGILRPRKRDVHRDDVVHAEAGIHFEHFHQAAPEQSRSDHEHQGDRDLRRHDDPADALAAPRTCLSAPAFDEVLAQVAGRRAYGSERSEAGGDRGGEEEREHQDWNIDRDAVQPWQVVRRQRHQSRHAPERSQHAKTAAGQRKQEGFGQELTDQPAARRTERAANGELALSDRRLCEQQVRDVRARHQQQESHGAEQNQQRRASLARDRVLQRDDHSVLEEVIALLARRIVNAPGDRADVPIRLLDGHAVAEAPDGAVVVRRPAWILAVQIGRQPQIRRLPGNEIRPGARR